ncbi:MAG: magnesium/cobalt transporter CorA [Alphaproteobacteria bacterium]|nr:magnesium/cobalt transporter CorA [Alphaproteobacteria bacterium]
MAKAGHPGRSRRAAKKRVKTSGMAPGSAVYTGPERDSDVTIEVIEYGEDAYRAIDAVPPKETRQFTTTPTVSWINVTGVHDAAVIEQVCGALGIHPLAMEDVLHTDTRPKAEDYVDFVFAAAKMIVPCGPDEDGLIHRVEQVALVLGNSWVVTFQETHGDVFDPLRRRIESGLGRIRRMRADYLAHAILDAIVDGYFEVLERFEEHVAELEDEALLGEATDLPKQVHHLKVELLAFRRLVWPLREAVAELLRLDDDRMSEATRPFFRDLHDHVLQTVDLSDSLRDRLAALLELHLAVTGARTNDVMRVLTVVATIFIPLTFVAGIYGMNFDDMPELHWAWGYPLSLLVMGAIAVVMLAFFRRRGWL